MDCKLVGGRKGVGGVNEGKQHKDVNVALNVCSYYVYTHTHTQADRVRKENVMLATPSHATDSHTG